MDALTWFKSVFHRGRVSSDLSHADTTTDAWDDAPLHLVAARLRPTVARPDGDEDWDAVIARAKMQAAPPKVPSPLPPPLPRHAPAKVPTPPPRPPARDGWAEMPPTPPPTRRTSAPAETLAMLNARLKGGLRKMRAPPSAPAWRGARR